MDNQIINILESTSERFKLYYGVDEIIKLSKDDFALDYDGWITITNKKNVEYIKLESIYKIICLPKKEYVYAIIPKHEEVKEQILDILSDGEEYSTQDIKRILGENAISDEKTGKKITKNKLKEKIDWASSFPFTELRKAKLIESKHQGYNSITQKGLDKLNKSF